jgi:ankyrin repeat protein
VYSIFGDTGYIEAQKFNRLHKIVLGFYVSSLEDALKDGDTNINGVDINNKTPLHWAAARGDIATTKLLLQYGADPNQGMSPLIPVCHHGYFDVANELVDHGAAINLRELDGYTPLAASCRIASGTAFALKLLKMGHSPNYFDEYGSTPLRDACERGMIETMRVLIENGADVNMVNNKCRSPLWEAIYQGQKAAVTLLLDSGASLEYIDVRGLTTLHWLARFADEEMIGDFVKVKPRLARLNSQLKSHQGLTAWKVMEERDDVSPKLRNAFQGLLAHCDKELQGMSNPGRDEVDQNAKLGGPMPGSWLEG